MNQIIFVHRQTVIQFFKAQQTKWQAIQTVLTDKLSRGTEIWKNIKFHLKRNSHGQKKMETWEISIWILLSFLLKSRDIFQKEEKSFLLLSLAYHTRNQSRIRDNWSVERNCKKAGKDKYSRKWRDLKLWNIWGRWWIW